MLVPVEKVLPIHRSTAVVQRRTTKESPEAQLPFEERRRQPTEHQKGKQSSQVFQGGCDNQTDGDYLSGGLEGISGYVHSWENGIPPSFIAVLLSL